MYAQKLLKKLEPCIAALPKDPQADTKGQAWLRNTAALLQSDSEMEIEQVQELLNEGFWAVRNTPDLSFPKPERSYIGMVPQGPECEIVAVDELEDEEMISSARAVLLAKVV